MKERPILFSAPMVRAILDGTKTQTRRIIKDQDIGEKYCDPCDDGRVLLEWLGEPCCGSGVWDVPEHSAKVASPFGLIGDRLWVREAWNPDPPDVDGWGYTAWAGCRDGRIAGVPERFRHPHFCNYAADWLHGPIRWTPSIHMPRWASRITLEVTGVRVERLQDISEADAIAEGVKPDAGCRPDDDAAGFHRIGTVRDDSFPIARYGALWERINGPGSWDANPWVWIVQFRKVG